MGNVSSGGIGELKTDSARGLGIRFRPWIPS
jgi:hypothetical protein